MCHREATQDRVSTAVVYSPRLRLREIYHLLQGSKIGLHSYVILTNRLQKKVSSGKSYYSDVNRLPLYILGVQLTKHDSALDW
jgi:hypothetical protein